MALDMESHVYSTSSHMVLALLEINRLQLVVATKFLSVEEIL